MEQLPEELLECSVKNLLKKFGKGKHIPGSGSAAALNGLLSCQMIVTVIQVTLRSNTYSVVHDKCESIKREIISDIQPSLEKLFQEDSEQFKKAMDKRLERNREQNQKKKNELNDKSIKELEVATEIPITIANICYKLKEFSEFLFYDCAAWVRGDSMVAYENAAAGVKSCIGIAYLNLHSYPENNWTNEKKEVLTELQRKLVNSEMSSFEMIQTLDKEAELKNWYLKEIKEIKAELKGKSRISDFQIENLTIRLQQAMWRYRKFLWKKFPDIHPLNVLDIKKAIKEIKYSFREEETLGIHDYLNSNLETAGIINMNDMSILVSKKFPKKVMNFTAAHELGHALLHDDEVLHRDIPLESPSEDIRRPIKERQADKFASYFLMPEKQVRHKFNQIFEVDFITINEITSFQLESTSVAKFKGKYRTRRAFSQLISSVNFFGNKNFQSLTELFGVSKEAMAIRLEELDLVKY